MKKAGFFPPVSSHRYGRFSMKCVAVVCARGLGDALLSMILSHNLSLSGIKVTTFSDILCELKEWFPHHTILPYPSQITYNQTFSAFDTVIAADHSCVTENQSFGNHLIVLKERHFDKHLSMVDNLCRICHYHLALPHSEKSNGLTVPQGLVWLAHPQRVIIHPTSADTRKNWPAKKFIQLTQQLENTGFNPIVCVSPAERERWLDVVAENQLPLFPTVHHLACFIYESGAMIGNDSGIGHLASALHIPTLSLFARKSYSHLWRPGWGCGTVVTPLSILPGARLKQKYWTHLLSVRRVHKAFIIPFIKNKNIK